MKYYSIILFSLFAIPLLHAQEVTLGAGSYNLSPPIIGGIQGKVPQDAAGNTIYPKVNSSFNQPAQSNDWWTSLMYNYYDNTTFLWEMHSWKLYAHPLAFVANRYGLDVKYPTQITIDNYYGVTNGKYQYPTGVQDFTIGLKNLDLGTTTSVKTAAYGDWHVKANWDDGINSMEMTMAHGSPYVYVEKSSLDSIYLRFFHVPSIDNNIGNNILGITINGHHYGLFAPTGSTWETTESYTHDENHLVSNPPNMISRNTFSSDLNGQDYFSIAVLPDNSLATLQDYAQYAFAFIDDTEVSWSYDENNATLTSTFTTSTNVKEGTESQTLQALYLHQWKNSTSINTAYTYDTSPRGQMKVYRGDNFTTSLQNHGIIPTLPLALDAAKQAELYDFIDDEYLVTNTYITSEDTYWQGKRFGRQADLILIANQVGHIAARDQFIADLKAELEDWFHAPDGESDRGYFYYDSNWNTLLGYPASFGAETQLNDHHFHYGYFIKAAATITQFDPTWATDSQWGSMVKLLIKDVSNWDKTDTQFPFLRNFDAYAGHSWANGHGNFHFGNDQESSSEAISYAAWVYFFGLHTNDDTLRDLGIFLYLTEADAARKYWFDEDADVFPSNYPYISAARIWGNGADKVSGGQSFELESEYQLGINTFPIQGPLLYLAENTTMVANSHAEASMLDDGIGDLWEDIMWGLQAMYEPATALADYENHTTPIPYNNNIPWLPNVNGIYEDFSDYSLAPAQIYHWLNALDSLGIRNNKVTANYPSSMVFDKNGDRYYIVHNYEPNSKTVLFSDGTEVVAPANTLHLYYPITLPVELVDFSVDLIESEIVSIKWKTASETNADNFEIERANDNFVFEKIHKKDCQYPNGGNYNVLDESPIEGWNYYRLRINDLDGSFNYSRVISVKIESNKFNYNISPNPVALGSPILFSMSDYSNEKIVVQIFDGMGKLIVEKSVMSHSEPTFNIPTNDLAKGIYFATVVMNNNIHTWKKIVIY